MAAKAGRAATLERNSRRFMRRAYRSTSPAGHGYSCLENPVERMPNRAITLHMPHPLSRRDFLQVAAGAGAFASLDSPWAQTLPAVQPGGRAPAPGDTLSGWF